MNDLIKAIKLATAAHEGQKDKGGNAYIEHPLRVMATARLSAHSVPLDPEEVGQVAVLHDVIEDTATALADLVLAGLASPVINAVDAISKRDGETHEAYIERVKANPLACYVKLHDLMDNANLARLNRAPEQKDLDRQARYMKRMGELAEHFSKTHMKAAA